MDDIIAIARQMRSRSMAKTLAGTCKEILGNFFWGNFNFSAVLLVSILVYYEFYDQLINNAIF